ncbi:hypothetical protein Ddye_016823 [Dipteronia dyeriana]|uniref:Reverse transcriptase n=1 Tax=Dipteronia dyeriana TaxID=168575 RepID=A0AAD9WZ67_9ROSI|nr:hypothetical protein Ddye_016823 [Dipteronia dyeriana]
MDALSAPGPDGFSGRFFQRCWEIMGRDVIIVVQDFFHSGMVAPSLNSNFIVLIRKIRDSITVDQFRPIMLGNFLFKISSKILANRGTVKNLKSVMLAFRVYARISSLQSLVGMQISQLPFSCLGVPLFKGKPRKVILMPIADKILSKFAKWKGKSLSLAGRATLIRSVITDSFVHSFMVYKWPAFLTKMVTKKIRNFLWTGSCEECKLVGVAWNRCCRPYALGGLGLKDLALLNDSLLRKLTWKLITSNNFPFTFLRKRYIRQLQEPQGGKSVDLRVALSLVWHSVYDANSLGIGCMRNCVDDLLILHRFGLCGRPGKALVIKSVVWSPLTLCGSRSDHVTWRVRQAWQCCLHQILHMEFQVSHIFRKGNQVADALSKNALGLSSYS